MFENTQIPGKNSVTGRCDPLEPLMQCALALDCYAAWQPPEPGSREPAQLRPRLLEASRVLVCSLLKVAAGYFDHTTRRCGRHERSHVGKCSLPPHHCRQFPQACRNATIRPPDSHLERSMGLETCSTRGEGSEINHRQQRKPCCVTSDMQSHHSRLRVRVRFELQRGTTLSALQLCA
jgi:hypothetical protein